MKIVRSSFTVLLSNRKTYEVLVNLDTMHVEQHTHIAGVQPSLLSEDYEKCEELVRKDIRV